MDDEMQAALDAALEAGDPAEIDALLAKIDESDNGDETEVTPPTTEQDTLTDDGDESVYTRENAQQSGESQQSEPISEQVVVQQDELTEQQQAKDDEAQKKMQEMQDRIELLTSQLDENGIQPKKLAHEMTLSDDELKELEGDLEELGTLGKVTHTTAIMLQQMQKQLAALQQPTAAPAQQQQQQATPQETQAMVHKAIAATDGMEAILKNAATRDKAIQLDEQLKKDPAFANKPLEVRFKEVVKRMDLAPIKPQKSGGHQDSIVPNSLGSAGNRIDSSPTESLAELSPEELDAHMANLSEAELQQLFSNL